MDDLCKIKKHPPHPPKSILEKSIKHMLDVKKYGKIVGTCCKQAKSQDINFIDNQR